jgi:clan AA aspartic protease (TIGR02281 family)
MESGIIKCPRCDTDNPVESDICYVCGQALHVQPSDKAGKKWILFLVLMAFIGALYFYYRTTRQPLPPTAGGSSAPASITRPAANIDLPVGPASPESSDKIQLSQPRNIELRAGVVVIRDIADKAIAQIPAAVAAGGWVALPKQICLGGYDWGIRMDSENELRIKDGIIGARDQIGLWHFQTDQEIIGPELYPWTADKPLVWVAVQSERPSPKPVKLTVLEKQEHFLKVSLPDTIREPGVLLQADRVVGWTFGSLMEGGYVWVEAAGTSLRPEIRVDDFYRTTFANSREEEFTLASAMGDEYTSLERLAAFANGFRFDPKLALEDTPAHLRPEVVISKMKDLFAQAVQAGLDYDVAAVFDAQVLIEAADISLFKDVLRATIEGYGFEDAAELMEDVVGRIRLKDQKDLSRLAELRSGLYREWISGLLESGDIQGGRHAFELGSQSLPGDLNVRLLGVRLALADGDWAAAERLLQMKAYPPAFRDQVLNLKNQISELKGRAGEIVIHFTPGTQHIPVNASLSRSVQQKFIVDTGASMVTIPYSTAALLELSIDESNPRHNIYTAGGVIEAPEVVLPSIEIEGWAVQDVKALVVDIPDQPNLGLLGLNYLEKFRLDLNTDKGILLLEPR